VDASKRHKTIADSSSRNRSSVLIGLPELRTQVVSRIRASTEASSQDRLETLLDARQRTVIPTSCAVVNLVLKPVMVEMIKACLTREVLRPSAVEMRPEEIQVPVLPLVQKITKVLASAPITQAVAIVAVAVTVTDLAVAATDLAAVTVAIEAAVVAETDLAVAATDLAAVTVAIEAAVVAVAETDLAVTTVAIEVAVVAVPETEVAAGVVVAHTSPRIIAGLEVSEAQILPESDKKYHSIK